MRRRWMILFALVLAAAGNDFTAADVLSAKYPSIEDNRVEIILFSWTYRGAYRFALVRVEDREKFIARFPRYGKTLNNLMELEREISKIPRKGYAIVWRDDKDYRFIFPPENIVKRVQKFASAKRIDLQVIPTIYD